MEKKKKPPNKWSAEHSHRRKSSLCRSVMSMPAFCINQAGNELPARRKWTLQKARDELRALFDKA